MEYEPTGGPPNVIVISDCYGTHSLESNHIYSIPVAFGSSRYVVANCLLLSVGKAGAVYGYPIDGLFQMAGQRFRETLRVEMLGRYRTHSVVSCPIGSDEVGSNMITSSDVSTYILGKPSSMESLALDETSVRVGSQRCKFLMRYFDAAAASVAIAVPSGSLGSGGVVCPTSKSSVSK